jgi:hypothetical protein
VDRGARIRGIFFRSRNIGVGRAVGIGTIQAIGTINADTAFSFTNCRLDGIDHQAIDKVDETPG